MTRQWTKQKERVYRDMRKPLEARAVLRIIMQTNCMRCDYEESDGELRNHCLACARKVVTAIHKRACAAASKRRRK